MVSNIAVNIEKPKVDQLTLSHLLGSTHTQSTPLSLAQLLQTRGYSTELKDLTITLAPESNVDFSNCQFSHVNLSGHFNHKNFENVSFNETHFVDANFMNTSFNHVTFNHCQFENSTFKSSSYNLSTFSEGNIWSTDFSNSSFYQSTISNSIFTKSNFDNILDHENQVKGIHFVFTQEAPPEYAFQQDATYHIITPQIGIVEDSYWFSGPHRTIIRYAGDPLTIEYNAADDDNVDTLLAVEVEAAFARIEAEGLDGLSIPQFIINSNQPIINEIKAKALEMVEKSDGILIPGSGDDIHPEFYGALKHPYTDTGDSYYREILEFSLAEAAIALNKPLFGICHGSQVVNVYLGGTLHQHVPGQFGITPELTVLTHEGPLGSVIKGPIFGPSYHHQAVNKVADSLEVVAKYDGVIKATQSKEGKPIMLTQFHPEHEVDQNSKNILKQFMDLSSDTAMKTKVLTLSDMFHQNDSIFQDHNEVGATHVANHPAASSSSEPSVISPLAMPVVEMAQHHEAWA